MADAFVPITEFTVRQELPLFGQPCIIQIDGSRTGSAIRPAEPGSMKVLWDRPSLYPPDVLADVHLPAAVQVAFLNALYASYLSLPLAEIGRALEAAQAPGVPQCHRVHHRPLGET